VAVLTCAKLRTGWSLDEVVDDADGEAERDDVGVDLDESSSSGDSRPAEGEAVRGHGWLGTDEWCAALFGDAERLAWHACWPEAVQLWILTTNQ